MSQWTDLPCECEGQRSDSQSTQLHTLQTHAPQKAFFHQQKHTLIIFFKESVLERCITKSTAMTISSSPVPPHLPPLFLPSHKPMVYPATSSWFSI